jgi:hypothetical protein
MDGFKGLFVRRRNNNTSTVRRFLERILNVFLQPLHLWYTGWNGIVNKHGNIEIGTLKCSCNMSEVDPNFISIGSISKVLSFNLNHPSIRFQ